ncbi:MAG: hypothetical protein K0R15_1039 [Clostridiales bacterium]|jgi:uncharacterized membrane protein YuzA (DUF378 family)|nr:hypothetical protein [Clostridiales bacterium]
MDFVARILSGEFNYIVPISFILIGMIAGVIIFVIRYSVYTSRKNNYIKNQIKDITEQGNINNQPSQLVSTVEEE